MWNRIRPLTMRVKTVRQPLLCAALGTIAVSSASADVLDMVAAQSGVVAATSVGLAAQVSDDYGNAYPADSDPLAIGKTEDGGWYLSATAGANMVSDIKLKDTVPNFGNSVAGLSNVTIETDWGTSVDLAVGYELLNWMNVELQTGFTWNSISGMTGDWLDGAVVPLDDAGGSGDLYQIPVVANLVFDVPLGTSAEPGTGTLPGPFWNTYLSFNIGAGLQVNSYDFNSLAFSTSGTEVTFRYQAGVTLSTQVAYNISLGAYCRFSGSTGLDLGSGTADIGFGPATADLNSESFYNLAIGASLRVEF